MSYPEDEVREVLDHVLPVERAEVEDLARAVFLHTIPVRSQLRICAIIRIYHHTYSYNNWHVQYIHTYILCRLCRYYLAGSRCFRKCMYLCRVSVLRTRLNALFGGVEDVQVLLHILLVRIPQVETILIHGHYILHGLRKIRTDEPNPKM